MRRQTRKTLNALARYLLTERISGDRFARSIDMDRSRAQRLIWSEDLERSLTVDELKRICRAYPDLAEDIL